MNLDAIVFTLPFEVKIYPDNVHYQSKKGKSVTLVKNRTGARDVVDRKSL